jgi:hypothetical protein
MPGTGLFGDEELMIHSQRVTLALLVFVSLLVTGEAALCLSYDFQGQASLLGNGRSRDGKRDYGMQVRYIPQVTLLQKAGDYTFLDLEASLDVLLRTGTEDEADTSGVDLYRLKLRFATPHSETRLGLQQLNFGPAYLLRPLRWFDMLDPRDPLGITDGVRALSFRYVTPRNASFWLWGLYGNDRVKGYETLATPDNEVEFGGRIQLPVSSGEMGLTFHRRTVTSPTPAGGDFAAVPVPAAENFPEYRYAIDSRWDVEIGLWIEAAFTQQKSEFVPFEWQQMITLGGDYTLPVGNGPHILLEHMAVDTADRMLGWDRDAHVSGFMIGYPLGLMDRLSAIGFYSWEDEEYSQYLSWDRTWDLFTFHASGFRYPDGGGSFLPGGTGSYPGGYGAQVVLIFNH